MPDVYIQLTEEQIFEMKLRRALGVPEHLLLSLQVGAAHIQAAIDEIVRKRGADAVEAIFWRLYAERKFFDDIDREFYVEGWGE